MADKHFFETFFKCWETEATARQCANMMRACIKEKEDLVVIDEIIQRCSKYIEFHPRNSCYMNSIKTWQQLTK